MASKNKPSSLPVKSEKEVKTEKIFKSRRKSREIDHYNEALRIVQQKCKTLKLNEEEICNVIEKFKNYYKSGTQYKILISFNGGMMVNNISLFTHVKNAIAKAKLKYKVLFNDWGWFDGDKKTLDTLRECLPNGVKITPYGLDKIPFNVFKEIEKVNKPTNNTKDRKEAAKAERKLQNLKNAKRRIKHKISKKQKKILNKVNSVKSSQDKVVLTHKRGTLSTKKINYTMYSKGNCTKHSKKVPITSFDLKKIKKSKHKEKEVEKAELRKVTQMAYIDLQNSKYNPKAKGTYQHKIQFSNQKSEIKHAA